MLVTKIHNSCRLSPFLYFLWCGIDFLCCLVNCRFSTVISFHASRPDWRPRIHLCLSCSSLSNTLPKLAETCLMSSHCTACASYSGFNVHTASSSLLHAIIDALLICICIHLFVFTYLSSKKMGQTCPIAQYLRHTILFTTPTYD